MGIAGSWRHFWAQRSRSRLMLAVVCLAAALIAVGFVYIPAAWLVQGVAAFQAAGAYLLSFGGRTWLFAAGGVLIVCAALLIALPRRRPQLYQEPAPSAIAPVSVYVDAENQLQDSTTVRPFVAYLRKQLNGRRADLLYFANAMQPQTRATYKELYRFGFRPVDVPHAPFDDEEIKDAVDMELSLHAYDRALRGPEHQVFILVTGDRDFLPLIFRLHALGHAVHIWAKQPPKSFRAIGAFLDTVRVFDLRDIFPPDSQTQPPKTAKGVHGDKPADRGAEPISIHQAMTYTLAILQEANATSTTHPGTTRRFHDLLGEAFGNFLHRLGYDRGRRVDAWLELLVALGVLRRGTPGNVFERGSVDPALAAQHMEQFLHQLAVAIVALASQREDRVISYDSAVKRASAGISVDQPVEVERLRAMLTPSNRRWQAHSGYLCRCSRALGMVEFEEVTPGATIRVKLPATPALASTAPEAMPSPDKLDGERNEQGASGDAGL